MFSPATLAVLAPLLALSQATAQADLLPSDHIIANVTLSELVLQHHDPVTLASAALADVETFDCCDENWYSNYDNKTIRCHPRDRTCLKDGKDRDHYKDRCKKHKCDDKGDKGGYEKNDPHKGHDGYKGCHSCHKKDPHHDTPCHKGDGHGDDDPGYDGHGKDRGARYCKPRCYPHEKHCHQCWDDDQAWKPKSFITAHFLDHWGQSYVEKIWPDGNEHWIEPEKVKKKVAISSIRYYAEPEDGAVRCLPIASNFPWNPLRLKKYRLETKEFGLKVNHIWLEKAQPIELIRCDLP